MYKIIILAVVLAVYFLVMKPSQIREDCKKSARLEAVDEINTDYESSDNERQAMQSDYEELAYEECLEENGIE